jgi:hypothetical protein
MRYFIVALLFLISGGAVADEHRDEAAGYHFTVPPGWTKTADNDGVSLTSPRTEDTFGMCLVGSHALPGTESLNQAEIDARLAGKFDGAFWRELFKEMKDITLETSGEEVQNGRNTYYAVASYDESGARIKFKAVAHFVPGTSHHLYCAAFAAAYAQEEADFETVFDSFTPLDRGLVAGARPAEPFVHTTAPRIEPTAMRSAFIETARRLQSRVQEARHDRRKGRP